MERMTDDAAKKRRELEHELTLTMTAQVQGHKQSRLNFCLITTDFVTNTVVEAVMSGHHWDKKKVSVTDCLRECKNREFVWWLRKTGICEGSRFWSCLLNTSVCQKSFCCSYGESWDSSCENHESQFKNTRSHAWAFKPDC